MGIPIEGDEEDSEEFEVPLASLHRMDVFLGSVIPPQDHYFQKSARAIKAKPKLAAGIALVVQPCDEVRPAGRLE
jgi:hypothetical protein